MWKRLSAKFKTFSRKQPVKLTEEKIKRFRGKLKDKVLPLQDHFVIENDALPLSRFVAKMRIVGFDNIDDNVKKHAFVKAFEEYIYSNDIGKSKKRISVDFDSRDIVVNYSCQYKDDLLNKIAILKEDHLYNVCIIEQIFE